ncbi:hypothetical protein IE81DRAFT_119810 [Ceraceosorus guamensis]|uniref:Uncharacterized protein n=1 Tax=Ceraceosorus guamensis TaxID=1522189 RepID=A0A316VZ64_9BASI|nr:hypothetical protein IE81DRAFT_119810 [Ceraceosorus guamensis]PWN42719.1 hypothetical protein IE81DRAFT_119810 [Ceraceosorus guamensis]
MSTMTASSTMATGPGTEHALDLYGPSSVPPPSNSGVPTWEDEIVPALRKRLEAESARLGKRISRLDQAGSDGWVPLGAEQVARKVAAETYNGEGSKKKGPIASTSEWGISSAHHATPNAARYAAVITSGSGRREASDQARSFTQPADLTAYRQNRQAPASTSKAESVRRAREKADAYRQRSGDDSRRSRAREEEDDSARRLYADRSDFSGPKGLGSSVPNSAPTAHSSSAWPSSSGSTLQQPQLNDRLRAVSQPMDAQATAAHRRSNNSASNDTAASHSYQERAASPTSRIPAPIEPGRHRPRRGSSAARLSQQQQQQQQEALSGSSSRGLRQYGSANPVSTYDRMNSATGNSAYEESATSTRPAYVQDGGSSHAGTSRTGRRESDAHARGADLDEFGGPLGQVSPTRAQGRAPRTRTSSEATGLALASAAALGVGSAHHPPSGSTWDEVLPPAVARRVAQQKILAQGLDEGLIDAWDTKGLPLSRTQMMDLQAQAVANGPRSNSAHMSSSHSDAVRAQAEAEERERNARADQQHRDHLARYPRAEELQHYPAIVSQQQQQQQQIYPPSGNRTSPAKDHDAPASTAYTSSQLRTANGKDQEKVDKGCCGCLIM